MKKRNILFIGILLIIIVLLTFFNTLNSLTSNNISNTNSIIVTNISNGNNIEINDNNKIKQIIKILKNKTKMNENDIIPFRNLPHYRLKLKDLNNSIISEINFFLL